MTAFLRAESVLLGAGCVPYPVDEEVRCEEKGEDGDADEWDGPG